MWRKRWVRGRGNERSNAVDILNWRHEEIENISFIQIIKSDTGSL